MTSSSADLATRCACRSCQPKEPKPDGWHTYHICGGQLREVSRTAGGALCTYCGEWCQVRTSKEAK
jgi:hypothetical protein